MNGLVFLVFGIMVLDYVSNHSMHKNSGHKNN